MEKHVYFVRHGQSDSNSDGILRGKHAMLNDRGHKQAKLVAARIHRIGVDTLIASPYQRTLDTASYISKRLKLPIEESELFVECRRASLIEGMHREDPGALEIIANVFDGFATPGYRHSDEENFDDLKERALAALAFLAEYPSKRICVVTHGLFLRVLFCAATQGEDFSGTTMQNMMRSLETHNTGVSHFVLRQDPFSEVFKERWYVANWNDSAHLG